MNKTILEGVDMNIILGVCRENTQAYFLETFLVPCENTKSCQSTEHQECRSIIHIPYTASIKDQGWLKW